MCHSFQNVRGNTVRHTPEKYLQLRGYIDKDATADEHYKFYRDGIYDASLEIDAMLKYGSGVVADRYWLTTSYTYHQVMGVSVPKDDFQIIVMPSLTVILSLNHEVQIVRMLHRGLSIGDRRMLDKQQEIATAFHRNALEFGMTFVVIDTQRFTPEACAV